MPDTATLEITHLTIGDLRPDPAHPRRISDEELESLTRSINQLGFPDPVIARKEDNVVIGGYQCLLRMGRRTTEALGTVPALEAVLSWKPAFCSGIFHHHAPYQQR